MPRIYLNPTDLNIAFGEYLLAHGVIEQSDRFAIGMTKKVIHVHVANKSEIQLPISDLKWMLVNYFRKRDKNFKRIEQAAVDFVTGCIVVRY